MNVSEYSAFVFINCFMDFYFFLIQMPIEQFKKKKKNKTLFKVLLSLWYQPFVNPRVF